MRVYKFKDVLLVVMVVDIKSIDHFRYTVLSDSNTILDQGLRSMFSYDMFMDAFEEHYGEVTSTTFLE
jgi:hypothetical protein